MNKFLHFNITTEFACAKREVRKKWQSRTVATEPLNDQQVRNLAESFLSKAPDAELFAYLGVGVTFLSFKDRYNRSTGREEALKKLKLEKLFIESVEITNTHIFVRLQPFKGVKLSLRTNKSSGFSTVTGELVGS